MLVQTDLLKKYRLMKKSKWMGGRLNLSINIFEFATSLNSLSRKGNKRRTSRI